MIFICNDTEYEIVEKEYLENEEDIGLTDYQKQRILLKKLDKEIMIKTLKHELMHVWMYEYGHNQSDRNFTNEDVCEIVACSNNFVNEVVERYLKSEV
jgi:Zn-dependent peptidase ImmA (M78 family)